MAEYHPFSEAVFSDPHQVYRALREESPVHYVEEYGCWAYALFEDVWNACQDPETYTSAEGTTSGHLLLGNLEVFPALDMMDPPRHTQTRALISGFFTPGKVRRFETDFRNIVRTRLDVVRERGVFDVVQELGSHLSTLSVCRVLGLPEEDGETLRGYVNAIFFREPGNLGVTEAGFAGYAQLDEYFARLVSERRKRGQEADDVIGRYLGGEPDGRRMDDETVASLLKEIMIAGTDTLPKMLAATLHRLWEHPDARSEVIADKSLILDAFMESVRYDMPTQFMARKLTRDIDLRGQQLAAGSPILLLYPSASRDEKEFPDADTWDLHRRAPRTVGFGHGTHACLGRHVARLEARVALEEILSVMPDYEVDLGGAKRLYTEFVQGFSSLPIRFEPF
jgi:cytochrome P450